MLTTWCEPRVSLLIATAAIVLVGDVKLSTLNLMKPTFDDLLNAPSSSPMTSTHMNYMMNPVIMVLDKIFENSSQVLII